MPHDILAHGSITGRCVTLPLSIHVQLLAKKVAAEKTQQEEEPGFSDKKKTKAADSGSKPSKRQKREEKQPAKSSGGCMEGDARLVMQSIVSPDWILTAGAAAVVIVFAAQKPVAWSLAVPYACAVWKWEL